MQSSDRNAQAIADAAARDLSARSAGSERMSLDLAVDLVVCGVMLVGLTLLAQRQQPDFQRAASVTAWVGGGLCILWGVLGRRGTRCRPYAILTLAAAACMFVRQALLPWLNGTTSDSKGRIVMVLMAVSVVFCLGMLVKVAQEGKGVEA